MVFTTIQKFFPEEKGDRYPVLAERRNIVVIADEAHRSQYDFIDGFARHMRDALPNASFVGFTGTPIELRDANTRGCVWGLHQHLRHSTLGRGWGHGAYLLREPTSRDWLSTGTRNQQSTPNSMRRPKARRSPARRNSNPSGRSSKRW